MKKIFNVSFKKTEGLTLNNLGEKVELRHEECDGGKVKIKYLFDEIRLYCEKCESERKAPLGEKGAQAFILALEHGTPHTIEFFKDWPFGHAEINFTPREGND